MDLARAPGYQSLAWRQNESDIHQLLVCRMVQLVVHVSTLLSRTSAQSLHTQSRLLAVKHSDMCSVCT